MYPLYSPILNAFRIYLSPIIFNIVHNVRLLAFFICDFFFFLSMLRSSIPFFAIISRGGKLLLSKSRDFLNIRVFVISERLIALNITNNNDSILYF